MMAGAGVNYCFLCRKNSRDNPNLSFFRFPNNEERCSRWRSNLNLRELEVYTAEQCYKKYRLCSNHFEESMFSSLQKNRLHKNAYPIPISHRRAFKMFLEKQSFSDEELSKTSVKGLLSPQEQSNLESNGNSHIPGTSCEISAKDQLLSDTSRPKHNSRTSTAGAGSTSIEEISSQEHLITDVSTQGISISFKQSSFLKKQMNADISSPSASFGKLVSPQGQLPMQNVGPSELYISGTGTSSKRLAETSVQTLSLTSTASRKRKLNGKFKALERKRFKSSESLISDDDFVSFVDTNFSQELGRFIKEQLKFRKKSSKEYKQFALTLYFMAPQVYKFLSKTFQLPSESTLFRITRKWEMPPGLNDFTFSVLKAKAHTLEPKARVCILCLGEMPLKTNLYYDRGRDEIVGFHQIDQSKTYEPATNAMVVMARGVHSNWKQPVGYFFVKNSCSADDLKCIVFDCIEKMAGIGFSILAVVTDQSSNFYKLTTNLRISEEQPYFFVNEKKIYFLFDIPHLMKSTRNNFFLYHFVSENGKTDKQYLVSFYEKDKYLKFRLAPKLTDAHLGPSCFKNMRVTLAAQVLSGTVAAALNTYVALGALPLSANATISFVEKIDKLFDLLNSSRICNGKEYNRPFIGADYQISFLLDMKEYFKNIKCINKSGKDRTNSLKFINGWIITISAFLNLWDDLKAVETTLVYTRRFNQDCVENFFSKIRQSGNNFNPTPICFAQEFKKLFAFYYFNQSEGANCINDFDMLSTLKDSQQITEYFSSLLADHIIFAPLVSTTDYVSMQLPEKNSLTYLCGYLITKCLEMHSCDICIEYANGVQNLSVSALDSRIKPYQNKNKDATFGNLMMPSEIFINCIETIENKFRDLFPLYAVKPKIGLDIKRQLEIVGFNHPCSQFPVDYLLSLFVRVRIFFTLKFLNKNLLATKNKKDRKLSNLQHI